MKEEHNDFKMETGTGTAMYVSTQVNICSMSVSINVIYMLRYNKVENSA